MQHRIDRRRAITDYTVSFCRGDFWQKSAILRLLLKGQRSLFVVGNDVDICWNGSLTFLVNLALEIHASQTRIKREYLASRTAPMCFEKSSEESNVKREREMERGKWITRWIPFPVEPRVGPTATDFSWIRLTDANLFISCQFVTARDIESANSVESSPSAAMSSRKTTRIFFLFSRCEPTKSRVCVPLRPSIYTLDAECPGGFVLMKICEYYKREQNIGRKTCCRNTHLFHIYMYIFIYLLIQRRI